MIIIDSLSWGKIVVNGKEYRQVLITGEEVLGRDEEKLHRLFGTTHEIGDWEAEKLLEEKPQLIIVGSGWDGLLAVDRRLKTKSEELGIDLRILNTSEVAEEYNRLVKEGKKVNALIHTTC